MSQVGLISIQTYTKQVIGFIQTLQASTACSFKSTFDYSRFEMRACFCNKNDLDSTFKKKQNL